MRNCTECGKLRNNWQSSSYWEGNQRWWYCRNCDHWQLEEHAQSLPYAPKVLYIDIETALMKVYIYDLFVPGKRINKDLILQNSFVINWAAAWLDEEWQIKGRILSEVLTPREAVKQNDARILETLFYMMDEADYICGHNSNNFDLKKLKWRFLKHGWGYPHETKKLDSFKMSGETKPASRGLEHLSVEFGGKRKMGLDIFEWIEIVEKGTPKLLRKADKYCRGDVREGVGVLRTYAKAIEQSGKRLIK